jgi:hypothetical protein
MATQSQKFSTIKQEAKKSGAKPAIKTAAKLASQYNDLSKTAKKAAMAVIDKAYDMATSEKGSARITTSYKELYAKFLREYRAGGSPKAAFKEGTANTRDVKKDAGRPALKKGKRTVKIKGYTTNQYGRFKNKVGSTYYESRSNRMDVNTPVAKKKVKLAYGGMAKEGMMTKSKKTFKMPSNAEFNKMTPKQQKEVFIKFAESQGMLDINNPNFMYRKGGDVGGR